MADRYMATGNEPSITSSIEAALGVEGDALTRGRIYEFDLSAAAAPADEVLLWVVQRMSALGTVGSAVTPGTLDSDGPAAQLSAAEGQYSVQPTLVANQEYFENSINQRATFRFAVAPGGEILVPASATGGVAFNASGAVYTGAIDVTAHWDE